MRDQEINKEYGDEENYETDKTEGKNEGERTFNENSRATSSLDIEVWHDLIVGKQFWKITVNFLCLFNYE